MRRFLSLVGLLAVACSGGGDVAAPAAPQPTVGATTTLDPNELYADFPECEPLPGPTGHEPVPGAVELEGAWIESIDSTGPLVVMRGLIDATPIDLRDSFSDREDVELIYVEDEGFETEILVDNGEHRAYLKATIRCRTGSVIAQIVGPAADPDALPVPGQQG